jgi:hypothetical protein
MNETGRVGPFHYRYRLDAIGATPELQAKILYLIDGLHGNGQALATVEAMTQEESTPATGQVSLGQIMDPLLRRKSWTN